MSYALLPDGDKTQEYAIDYLSSVVISNHNLTTAFALCVSQRKQQNPSIVMLYSGFV